MTSNQLALDQAQDAIRKGEFGKADTLCRDVLRAEPINSTALVLLGEALWSLGDDTESLRLFQSALHCRPRYVPAYRRLASAYYSSGERGKAAEIYHEWATFQPDNPEVQHMLAATSGRSVPPRCSSAYIQTHFNEFARSFDDILVRRLSYRGHELVTDHFAKCYPTQRNLAVLDAGCGTGLCGPLLRPRCQTLTGVDLSENMLEAARKRGCYTEVAQSEICAFMASQQNAYDTIISSDVLIYFGELRPFFGAAVSCLKPRGLLIVTTESLSDDTGASFKIAQSGRYQHGAAFVRTQLEDAGLRTVTIAEAVIRMELGARVMGNVIVAEKSSERIESATVS